MDTLFIMHETDSFFSSLTPGRPSNTDKWTWPVRRCRQTGWMSIRVVMDVLELDMAHFQVLSLPWDGKTLSRCLLDILTATILYSSETCFLLWKIVDGRPHSCNQNTRENKSKKKALFWLMVSEVHSVVNLVPLILGWQWGRRPWLQHMEQDALCTGYLGSRPSVAFKGSLPVTCVLHPPPEVSTTSHHLSILLPQLPKKEMTGVYHGTCLLKQALSGRWFCSTVWARLQ